jgi:hypothetical protein
MKSGLIGITCIAVALLIADRILRIQPFIINNVAQREGFQMPILNNGRARACGVGMLSCPESTKCGNGLCISVDPVPLVEKYPLPVMP